MIDALDTIRRDPETGDIAVRAQIREFQGYHLIPRDSSNVWWVGTPGGTVPVLYRTWDVIYAPHRNEKANTQ